MDAPEPRSPAMSHPTPASPLNVSGIEAEEAPVAPARQSNSLDAAAAVTAETLEAELRSDRGATGRPGDVERMSPAELAAEKRCLKRLLRAFERDFAARHGAAATHGPEACARFSRSAGREVTREDKLPLRSLYTHYKAVKALAL